MCIVVSIHLDSFFSLFYHALTGGLLNILYKGLCRIYQAIMRLGSMFLPWREPLLLCGAGAIIKLPSLIREKNSTRVLLLTDLLLYSLGLLSELEKGLQDEAIDYVIYRDVQPKSND